MRIAAFYCLSELNTILGESLRGVNEILNNASSAISQIILSVIQSKVLNDQNLVELDSFEKSKALWVSLQSNDQVKLVERNLKLDLLIDDI